MSFLYFIEKPNEVKPTEKELSDLGLSYIVDRYSDLVHGATLNTGPGGNRGVIVMKRTDGVQPHYQPDRQEWRKVAGQWIGWIKGNSFEPSQFERDSLLDGYQWRDWKGNAWTIPKARRYYLDDSRIAQGTNLPTYLDVNEDGDFIVKGIQSKYEKLWTLATQYEDNRQAAIQIAKDEGSEVFKFDIGDLKEIFSVVIGTNYRLSSKEIGIMQVLSEQSAIEIMRLVVDEPGLISLQKNSARYWDYLIWSKQVLAGNRTSYHPTIADFRILMLEE